MATLRASVFIDYSNAFKRAGEMFCDLPEGGVKWNGIDGHFDPGKLADEIVKEANNQQPRESKMALYQIHVYCGIPARYVSERERDKRHTEDERTAEWDSRSYVLVHRVELNYEDGVTERGVDTLLAADLVAMAYDSAFDVAILVSRDSDFQAVLYEMAQLNEMRRETGEPCPRLDLAGWSKRRKGGKGPAETVPVPDDLGGHLFAKHRLDRAIFRQVAEDPKLREPKPKKRHTRQGANAKKRGASQSQRALETGASATFDGAGQAESQPKGAIGEALREARERKGH